MNKKLTKWRQLALWDSATRESVDSILTSCQYPYPLYLCSGYSTCSNSWNCQSPGGLYIQVKYSGLNRYKESMINVQRTKLDIRRSSLKSPLGMQQWINIELLTFLPVYSLHFLFHNTTRHSRYIYIYIYICIYIYMYIYIVFQKSLDCSVHWKGIHISHILKKL